MDLGTTAALIFKSCPISGKSLPPLSLFSSFEEGIMVVSASADSCEDYVRNQEG